MKNAAQILKASLADIKAGHWTTGDLGKCTRSDSGCELMGCALGLVSIHGDDIYKDEIKNIVFTNPNYPSFSQTVPIQIIVPQYANVRSPKAVIRAIAALSLAAGNKLPEGDDAWVTIDQLNSDVFDHNDTALHNGAKDAIKWFNKAIKLLPTVKLPKAIEDNYKTKAKVAA